MAVSTQAQLLQVCHAQVCCAARARRTVTAEIPAKAVMWRLTVESYSSTPGIVSTCSCTSLSGCSGAAAAAVKRTTADVTCMALMSRIANSRVRPQTMLRDFAVRTRGLEAVVEVH